MKSYRAGFSEKNPVVRKIPDKWSNSWFLSIFSTLKFFKFFYIVNLDNLNCFLSFAKNRKKPRVQKNLFRVLTTVNMRKMTFLTIFSTLKFFKFFFIVNLDNFNCFSSFAKNRRSKKNYFAFWRPSICEKWHFFDFKIFQNFLYCKFRQFKLFFIICKKPQKTAGPKKFISRFDDRQYAKNDIFPTLKFFKIFYIVNLDNLNCFSSFANNCRSKLI